MLGFALIKLTFMITLAVVRLVMIVSISLGALIGRGLATALLRYQERRDQPSSRRDRLRR